jgi:acyl-CoA reductase-like NAD-dependent aldehyde dehydrogenase
VLSKIKPHYIGGDWVGGDDVFINVNPSNTVDVIGEYARGDATHVEMAIASAPTSFEPWAHTTPQVRFDLLDRIGAALLARKEELGRLLSREEGKVLAEGIAEVTRAGYIFKFFAGESLRLAGQTIASVRSGVVVPIALLPVFGLIAWIERRKRQRAVIDNP